MLLNYMTSRKADKREEKLIQSDFYHLITNSIDLQTMPYLGEFTRSSSSLHHQQKCCKRKSILIFRMKQYSDVAPVDLFLIHQEWFGSLIFAHEALEFSVIILPFSCFLEHSKNCQESYVAAKIL